MQQALAWRMGERKDLARIEVLEGEVEKAKESEMKMLESLASQTKQLEETKIELEEAKLEIRDLRESIIRGMEGGGSASPSDRSLGVRSPEKTTPPKPLLDTPKSDGDVTRLRSELRLAIEAEEKNKKAMDELAFALKEVTTEMNQLKQTLSATQSELEGVWAEADESKLMLKTAEEKLEVVSQEAERLRLEADESTVAWNAKENGFINCMKLSEEEITKLKQDNFRLADSQRIAREENSKLRDIMKQALNEATVVKEALEIARRENSQLKDLLSDTENSLKAIKQDYENLKVSEGAALDTVEELKDLLAAAASSATAEKNGGSAGSTPVDTAGSPTKPRVPMPKEVGSEMEGLAKFAAEAPWKSKDGDIARIDCGSKDQSAARSASFLGSVSEWGTSLSGHGDRTCASLSSCASDLTALKYNSLHGLDKGDVDSDGFDHMDRIRLDGMSTEHSIPGKQKKKRQILRKFGGLLRRGSSVPKN